MYRALPLRELWSKIIQTAVVSGMVLFVVGAAHLLGWVLAVMQVPQALVSSLVGMGGGQAGFMILTILVFLPLGAILEGVPAYFELEQEEMYGERFDVPTPDELLMISWFQGGEVFRSLCTWRRGHRIL